MKQFIHLNFLEMAMNNVILSKEGDEQKAISLAYGELINEIGSLIVNGESMVKKFPEIKLETKLETKLEDNE